MGWNPLLQLQRYDPRVFTQAPFSQRPEKRRHSSMSKTEMFFRTWSYIRDTCLLKCMLRFKYSLLHIFTKNFLSWRKWQLRDKFPLRCTFTMPKWRKWKNWIRKEKKKRKERKRKNETLFSEIEQLQLTASNLLCRNEYQVIEFATVTQFSDRGWNRTYVLININPFIIQPAHERVYHTTGVYAPYSLRSAVWVLLRVARIRAVKELWDGTYGLSSLSKKTRIVYVTTKAAHSPQSF